ncbi:hypothetical protein IWX64_003266 [Arthrobacter sp. CAN_A212]|uniref:hypothetical protein n=1 Tax=Arthrobacter sp. CAN_A212 TaxID=2787719 RepID=UPI0018CA6AFE
MSNLFSDAVPLPAEPDPAPVLAYSVNVPVPPDHAYAGFVDNIHLWWPAQNLSIYGVGSFFDLEDGTLVETSPENEEAVWADVFGREDGCRLDLAWHHQLPGGTQTELSLRFDRIPDEGTLVSLTHGGWSTAQQSHTERSLYEAFWPTALEKFKRFMGAIL